MKKLSVKKEYKNATADTFLIVVFTTLPTLLGFFSIILGGDKKFYDLFSSGEFLLYSVSFLGSAYIVFNQFTVKYKNLNNFSKMTIGIAIMTSIAYASLINISPSPLRLSIISIIALIMAISVFYYSQVISSKHSPDIGEERNEEIKKIQDELI